MGKSERKKENFRSNLPPLSSPSEETSGIENNDGANKCHLIIEKIFRPRCIASLVLGFTVLLSAVFWLPPFLGNQEEEDYGDVNFRYSNYEANIVATFILQRSVHELRANNQKLCYDIFDKISIPNSTVSVIGMKALPETNWTDVVVGIKPYPTNSSIPTTSLSVLRANFVSMVAQQSELNLTKSLFGNASFFQVLEFPGGITILPPQSSFLQQKVQIMFNFTLNLSIFQVKYRTDDLREQMAKGLHLSSNESLYFRYTNLLGSTVFPPVIIQTAVVPVVGLPSDSRLKELAETVACSPTSNLGLNHTVFGQVKQVHFSSSLQGSSSTGMDKSGKSSFPAPAPVAPQSMRYHHHQKQPQNHTVDLSIHQTPPTPPPDCKFGFNWKFNNTGTQFTPVPTRLGLKI